MEKQKEGRAEDNCFPHHHHLAYDELINFHATIINIILIILVMMMIYEVVEEQQKVWTCRRRCRGGVVWHLEGYSLNINIVTIVTIIIKMSKNEQVVMEILFSAIWLTQMLSWMV